jgi:hypothetical protein
VLVAHIRHGLDDLLAVIDAALVVVCQVEDEEIAKLER